MYSNLDTLRVYFGDIEKVVRYHSISTAKNKDTLDIDIDYLLDDGKDIIEVSLEGAVRARDIINNLRIYSHPDNKSTEVACLYSLLETAVKIANTQIKYNSVMDLQLAEDKPKITANATQLNQVIINIIVNANQAVPEGKGIITLNCRKEGDTFYVDIADNGSGIPLTIQPKIFEPFFTTKVVGHETGLGLSLSKAIVEQHSGTIKLCHSDADGTFFAYNSLLY